MFTIPVVYQISQYLEGLERLQMFQDPGGSEGTFFFLKLEDCLVKN